jgi:hypothetical protein
MAFVLGALTAWRLEGRRPLVAPLWLVITRNLAFIALAAFIVVAMDPPSRIAGIDPLWWNGIKALILVGAVVALLMEVRHALRERRAHQPPRT